MAVLIAVWEIGRGRLDQIEIIRGWKTMNLGGICILEWPLLQLDGARAMERWIGLRPRKPCKETTAIFAIDGCPANGSFARWSSRVPSEVIIMPPSACLEPRWSTQFKLWC